MIGLSFDVVYPTSKRKDASLPYIKNTKTYKHKHLEMDRDINERYCASKVFKPLALIIIIC